MEAHRNIDPDDPHDETPAGVGEIPLSKPDIGPLEEQFVLEVLRSDRLSIGPMQARFEHMVAGRAGRTFGVGVNSGTSGLHLALTALGIGPGDEVITTPLSFVASSNAILMVGATPKFVDVCPKSLNMDPRAVEAAITDRTAAILAVETFGNPTHLAEIERIAARHELPMIEDCCEALGTRFNGRACGSFGRVGVFGFYPNKQVTTGEGGMIVTDDERLAGLCRSLRNQGRPDAALPGADRATGAWLAHERLGYNYRLDELSAALGVAQMQRLDELIERRQKVAELYTQRLLDASDLIIPTLPEDDGEGVFSWFVYVVRLAASYTRAERDRVIRGLREHEIGAGDYFPCIHLMPFYREKFGFREGMFPIAESVSQRTIALPFHTQMTPREVDLVAQTLAVLVSRENLSRG